MRTLLALPVLLGLHCLLPQSATAQSYPKRSITMIVPFAAGGATDVIARIVSEAMSRELGQPIVVENVAGAVEQREVCERRMRQPMATLS